MLVIIQFSSPGRVRAKVRANPASEAEIKKLSPLVWVDANATQTSPEIVAVITPRFHSCSEHTCIMNE